MAALDMKEFARRGALARISELNQELEAIYGAFPELRKGGRKVVVNHEEQGGARRRTANRSAKEPPVADTPRPGRRRQMSAAERKAVSERMRKYWESRRAEAGTKKR